MKFARLIGTAAGTVVSNVRRRTMGMTHVREVVGRAVMRLGDAISPEPRDAKPVSREHFAVKKLELAVVGVTFSDRQSVIRGLKGDEEVRLLHMPTRKYPNRIAVLVGGIEVGHISDRAEKSVAKWLLGELEYGYTWEVVGWRKVGGMFPESKYGLRIDLKLSKPMTMVGDPDEYPGN